MHMHVMLLGGSFDPPHLGHLEMTHSVVAAGLCDEVWFVPCASHPFSKNLSATSVRLAMLRLLDHVNINTFELDQPMGTVSYSIDTLRGLAQRQPEHTFSLLIGSDLVADFMKWQEWRAILEGWKVFVYPREGSQAVPILEGMVPLRQMQPIAISSTDVRERVRLHLPIDQLVPPTIAEYISHQHLYDT